MKRSEVNVPFRTPTRPEREIVINKTAGDEMFHVYTSDPVYYRLLVSRGHEATKVDEIGAWFEVPHITIPSRRVKDEPRRAA